MTLMIRIRPARAEDAATLARVHVDAWRTTYSGIVPDEYLANLSYASRDQLRRERLTASDTAMFVYDAETHEGQIIGLASGGAERETDPVYIGELYGQYLLLE